ncbi:hypothetical protein P4O66_002076 [Electrophorus voltai]|uniref:Ig-like domain-containing protein n=1 Tax=Electrophorus voltai TaxID=2609070 RepID=A0AAD9DQ30_9TELE|nr:hypothetical protein P4O66_002076 [Electrophorus voltai]
MITAPTGRLKDLDTPVLTVHQTISDVRGNYYQEKTVFLRCTVNSNPPARFIWKRANTPIEQSKDNGVDIYEPLYTQGETKVLKLKNLRPQDFADYTCQVSVRNVCDIPDTSVTFSLTNATIDSPTGSGQPSRPWKGWASSAKLDRFIGPLRPVTGM